MRQHEKVSNSKTSPPKKYEKLEKKNSPQMQKDASYTLLFIF
jgi:hypothetical protein